MKDKLKIITKTGVSNANIGREYGILEITMRGWMFEEAKSYSLVNKLNQGLGKRKTRLGQHQHVDDCHHAWFVLKISECISVSGTALKLRDKKSHVSLKLKHFKVPNGWLWRWQK